MFLSFKRVFNFAWLSFKRNLISSISPILIIFLTLFVITFFYLFQGFVIFITTQIEQKADISVYLKEGINSEKAIEIKEKISQLPEVKEVKFISSEEALERFLEKHQSEKVFLEALEALGENPFLATLNINVSDKKDYPKIVSFLENSEIKEYIDHHSFYKSQSLIERIYSLSSQVKKITLIISGFFVLITVLIIYNTIKLTILSQEKEISIMRSIGASNFYLQGPFVLEGGIFGFFSAVFCFFIWFGLSFLLKTKFAIFLAGFDPFNYFIKNLWQIFVIQFLGGIILGMITSFICTKKYLKI
jgi:cell division transport system permease protein